MSASHPPVARVTPVLQVDVTHERPPFRLRVDLTSQTLVNSVQGPSGAGKSTLLRILAGVERDAVGTVTLGGARWQEDPSGPTKGRRAFVPPWERRVGWAPQGALLFPHLDVQANLAYGGASGDEVATMAELLEIAPLLARDPSGLSGGERQRVALGRALLSARSLLLLDEPFSALDPDLRQELVERVAGWTADAGLPAVIVSHDEDDLSAFGGERWWLVNGEVKRGANG